MSRVQFKSDGVSQHKVGEPLQLMGDLSPANCSWFWTAIDIERSYHQQRDAIAREAQNSRHKTKHIGMLAQEQGRLSA